MSAIFTIDDLEVEFTTPEGVVNAVNSVSLEVSKGECLAVVGESGSGKSQTFMAAMGLLAVNGSARGSVQIDGIELLNMDEKRLNNFRGDRISMIFQDPMTSLTPHMKVGRQLVEAIIEHRDIDMNAAERQAVRMLEQVHFSDAKRILNRYPHELSGGMRQRVMIAMALICKPSVIIADEPTTALDVTVQAQIIKLLMEAKDGLDAAIILITHDLGVVAGLADRVSVMYSGRVVESGTVEDIFYKPSHPYTEGLLSCTPNLESNCTELMTIPGQPPNTQDFFAGCSFEPRCSYSSDICKKIRPVLSIGQGSSFKACHFDSTGGRDV
ncbi:MAG: ABC transporter ATP-binding protein [Rhodospirillaceae bacterium]|mgnify:CR=1 FL=1|nr:ABC transporter ATP-binding protein [Rhodospirillaceae bacterium]